MSTVSSTSAKALTLHCRSWSNTAKTEAWYSYQIMYHWNHTKLNFGMIPVAIWYEYHTSVFAVKQITFKLDDFGGLSFIL